ncbi:MAG: TetR/AcrR family transcriptional regulator, partial [Acidovorax sp.]
MPALIPHDPHGPEAGAKRSRRKEARPRELLDAALDLFVEKGYAATRVDEVAARAGVSKGTVLLYFPSKLELFDANKKAIPVSTLTRDDSKPNSPVVGRLVTELPDGAYTVR